MTLPAAARIGQRRDARNRATEAIEAKCGASSNGVRAASTRRAVMDCRAGRVARPASRETTAAGALAGAGDGACNDRP